MLYLKADLETSKDYEREGCGPFIYEGKTKLVAMSYWRVPERLDDEPVEFVEWVRLALRAAAATKPKGSRKAQRPTPPPGKRRR